MDILNNIRYGVELERAQMPNNGLNENPGWWNAMWGGISGATQQGVDNKRSAVDNAAANRLLEQSGRTRAELGLTPDQRLTEGSVATAIRDLKEGKIKAEQERLRTNAVSDRNAGFTQQSSLANAGYKAAALQGELGRKAAQDQYLHSSKTQEARYAHEASEGKLNRRHESELADQSNNIQMQMSIMSNDLAEKRMDYDRETRRMDKRSAAIAQLMSGLGSLGGAFAL